ncbi:hypothetical protein IscW_ISCW012338 [Ixodes scapularis]|uniref:Uncharacterized protein n=1 Tax=Ixodes scapularis TaxID=6945 RepID=B7QCE7_IXOSC|nr:hypothetical protein IscW_ISCW012338 [Ixodes scapularis]|eukprot:XP_002413211.1 hypothetical protein IscW_ISCW012338 [Ixodes scapularis]
MGLRQSQQGQEAEEEDEGSSAVATGVNRGLRNNSHNSGSPHKQRAVMQPKLDASKTSRMSLPEVDMDDAVKIWCSQSQPSQQQCTGPSAWMVADQEHSSPASSVYDDDQELSSETTSDSSSETTSTTTISSGMLRQWRCIRKRYADNPDVLGEILVYRVLTYMGHPHWRKSVRPQGTSPSLTTVLQATMALRLEELRQKRLQMDAAWQMLKVNSPLSRFVLESKRQAVAELEASVIIDTMNHSIPPASIFVLGHGPA